MRYLFLLLSVGDLAGNLFFEPLHTFCKPFLLVSLMLYFWQNIPKTHTNFPYWILAALAFSWAGDVFLLFKGETFFIAGLGSFLIAHLLYLVAYQDTHEAGKPRLIAQKPYLLFPFTLYLVVFYAFLYPYLGDLAVPVGIYAMVLANMGILALNRYRHTTQASFNWIMAGALCFMLSDSWLSVHLFVLKDSSPLSGFCVMLTYLTAQYAIVHGALLHLKK